MKGGNFVEFKGIIKKVIFPAAGAEQKNGWASVIIKLNQPYYAPNFCAYKRLRASGQIYEPLEGASITADGEFVIDPEYGPQIKITKSCLALPLSKVGIMAFLERQVSGIGNTLANRIYDTFGLTTFYTIENSPEKLLKVKGMSKKILDNLIVSYKNKDRQRDLIQLFNGQISDNKVQKILERYKKEKNLIGFIKKNPYQLIYDIDGMGFLTVDKLALQLMDKYDMRRIEAAVVYALTEISEQYGHVFASCDQIQDMMINLLCKCPFSSSYSHYRAFLNAVKDWDSKGKKFLKEFDISEEKEKEILLWLDDREKIIELTADAILKDEKEKRIVIEENSIYTANMYYAETQSAKILAKMLFSPIEKRPDYTTITDNIKKMEDMQGFSFASKQNEGIHETFKHRIHLLTGGPGTGKTATINAIVSIWKHLVGHVICCAPTGKAAEHLSEITHYPAFTIHRMINEHNGISDKTLIIVDESTMIDQSLACKLLNYCSNGNILFVGDIDQLASVGPGNFFKSMIENSYIHTTVLDFGFRNAGSIALNSKTINSGGACRNLVVDDDFQLITAERSMCQGTIIAKYKELRKHYLPKDIGLLLPMKKGSSGIQMINHLIRDFETEKDGPQILGLDVRLRDRLMCTKNDAKKPYVTKDGQKGNGIWNGDCGTVISIDELHNVIGVLLDDGRIIAVDKKDFDKFIPAFAMTIHKSQGSEYKAVIVCMTMENFIMLKRSLLYTAMTRAKNKLILIGEENAFNRAARTIDDSKRNTKLNERITLELESLVKKSA